MIDIRGKTPGEVMLEKKVAILEARLQSLTGRDGTNYSVSFEAPTINVQRVAPQLSLAIAGGFDVKRDESYHVWAHEHATVSGFKLGYYITDREAISKYARAEIMRQALEAATYQLAAMLEAA